MLIIVSKNQRELTDIIIYQLILSSKISIYLHI
nr:MAG TPA: hypothetical protein [Caudoviricetes sp.]